MPSFRRQPSRVARAEDRDLLPEPDVGGEHRVERDGSDARERAEHRIHLG
jgi:hypothetical protein